MGMVSRIVGAVSYARSALQIAGVAYSGTAADLNTLAAGTSGVAAATAGAATLAKRRGKITSESISTAAAALYTLTLTDTEIAAADLVFASVANGTNTGGSPVIEKVTPAAGSVVILVRNAHASTAFNGTLVVAFVVLKA